MHLYSNLMCTARETLSYVDTSWTRYSWLEADGRLLCKRPLVSTTVVVILQILLDNDWETLFHIVSLHPGVQMGTSETLIKPNRLQIQIGPAKEKSIPFK